MPMKTEGIITISNMGRETKEYWKVILKIYSLAQIGMAVQDELAKWVLSDRVLYKYIMTIHWIKDITNAQNPTINCIKDNRW